LKFKLFLIYIRYLFSLLLFSLVSQLLTVLTLFIFLLNNKSIQGFRSLVLMWFARFVNTINFNLHIKKYNETNEKFKIPSVIISNHVSLVDISIILSLAPKLIIVTNANLMHSRFYWLLKKYAPIIELADNVENSLQHLKHMQQQGYSILVFPESKRSPHKIQRFHKSAFMLAEKLNMDILPLLIKAEGAFVNKHSFYRYAGKIQINILHRITPDNKDFGDNYSERAKNICEYYRSLR